MPSRSSFKPQREEPPGNPSGWDAKSPSLGRRPLPRRSFPRASAAARAGLCGPRNILLWRWNFFLKGAGPRGEGTLSFKLRVYARRGLLRDDVMRSVVRSVQRRRCWSRCPSLCLPWSVWCGPHRSLRSAVLSLHSGFCRIWCGGRLAVSRSALRLIVWRQVRARLGRERLRGLVFSLASYAVLPA